MQIAEAEDVDQFLRIDPAGEDETVQVVVVLFENVLAVGLFLDAVQIATVADPVRADAQKDHVIAGVANLLG